MSKIVTFGELMIRLQPYNYERFVQADHLEFSFGGGEANVAVSLANYGMDAAFVTKLPAHAIGQAAVNSLRRYGVDTSEIVKYCQEKGITCFPGCTTPTDYHTAYKLGLEVLKFFPAEQSGGLAKIKAMAAPFAMFKVMPTGGINLKNLAEYAACPVIVACGGSYMCPDKLITEGKWDEIIDLCKKSVEIVKEARK